MSYTIVPSPISWILTWADVSLLLQDLRIATCATSQLNHVLFAGSSINVCQSLYEIWQQILASETSCTTFPTQLLSPLKSLPIQPKQSKNVFQQQKRSQLPLATSKLDLTSAQPSTSTNSSNPDSFLHFPQLFDWKKTIESPCKNSSQETLTIFPLPTSEAEANVVIFTTNFHLWLQIKAFLKDEQDQLSFVSLSTEVLQDQCTFWQVKLIVEPEVISNFLRNISIKLTAIEAGQEKTQNNWDESIQQFRHYFHLRREYQPTPVSASHTTPQVAQEIELLNSVLQEMPIGMFQASLDGGILSANPAFCQLTGYTLAQLRHLDLQAITELADRSLELEMIRQVVQYREQRIYEKRYRKASREIVWAEVKLSLVGDPDTDTSYLLGFATDLSDRHEIEEERIRAAQEIQNRQERETLLNNIAVRIRSAVDLPTMLHNAAEELKQALRTDRIVIYQILPDGGGVCITEAVNDDLPTMQGQAFGSDCIPPPYLDAYRYGRLWSVNDTASAGLTDCHLEMLEQLNVKSMVATGILSMDESLLPDHRTLWGLLAVHHCRAVRTWLPEELQLIEAVANQLAIALEQTKLLNRLTSYTQELEERVRERTQSLERSLRFEQHIRSLTECLHRDLDENHLFETVVNRLVTTLEVDACFASFYNAENNTFEIKFEALTKIVPPHASMIGQQFSLQDLPVTQQERLLNRQTCYFSGPLAETNVLKLISNATPLPMPSHLQVSEVVSPIVRDDGLVGMILVLQFKPHQFAPDEIKIIEQTIHYCAIALRQAQLHRHEHEHRLSAEYFRSFLDESVDVVVEYDAQLRYISINRAGCALLNRPRQEILGKTNQELFKAETNVLDLPIQQAFKTGEKVYLNHEINLPQGNRVFETVYAPIVGPTGLVQRVIGICRDVTDFKQQWQLLENQNHQLAETTRLKEEFVATTSHELRTPLTAILGFSNVLLQEFFGELNAKQKDYIERIYGSGQHLLDLINDILDLSRLEAGRMELDLQAVYVADICEGVLGLIQERVLTQGLDLQVEIAPDVEWIVADPRRLKQMLLNLLTNAVKFTVQGSVGIKVYQQEEPNANLIAQPVMELSALSSKANVINFVVWDTGIGIHEADQQLLFAPFSQIDSSLSRKHQGTGLGLVITRKLAELHGGWVTLESRVGQGSKFTISLPLRNDIPMMQVL